MTTGDKALALVNEVRREYPNADVYAAGQIALCRAIKQHEAFRQEVSDAMRDYYGGEYVPANSRFAKFIIPAPKPDPLVEAMAECGVDRFESWADQLRAALDALGFEVRGKNDG